MLQQTLVLFYFTALWIFIVASLQTLPENRWGTS